jgi:hypothetical protein
MQLMKFFKGIQQSMADWGPYEPCPGTSKSAMRSFVARFDVVNGGIDEQPEVRSSCHVYVRQMEMK